MKKSCLFVIGLCINLLGAFSQVKDSGYRQRRLKIDEVNFISSYYSQDGNNSAVTGGTGTEKLKDYSNNLEVKLVGLNKRKRKVDVDINLGVDYYTSASSDQINPYSISSASSRDLRIYPSVSRAITDEEKGHFFSTGISYSHESDYESYGLTVGIGKKTKNNTEFTAKAQVYLDRVKIILPVELRTAATGGIPDTPDEDNYPWKGRNTFSTSFSFSKIVNQRLQLMLLSDLTYQQGFLSLPFHRIYFKDNAGGTERLPSSRFKIPVGIKANYFKGDRLIIRSFYRFYKDDWGLNAHTLDMETVLKITPFFSVSPFYRYYSQSAIDFFAGYRQHDETERYYSSNYDFSKFTSHFFGSGIRFAPPKGVLGKKRWNMIEIRYGHYKRTNGLRADILSLHFKYK